MNKYFRPVVSVLFITFLIGCGNHFSESVLDEYGNINTSLEISIKTIQNAIDNRYAEFEATLLKNEPEQSHVGVDDGC